MANSKTKRSGNTRVPSSVKTAAKRNKTASNLSATNKSPNVLQQRLPQQTNAKQPAHRNTHPPNSGKTKLNIGLASILAQSGPVVEVFGRLWGFVLIMSAILASTGFTVTSALILMKGVGRLL
jgi:hypothetical protein